MYKLWLKQTANPSYLTAIKRQNWARTALLGTSGCICCLSSGCCQEMKSHLFGRYAGTIIGWPKGRDEKKDGWVTASCLDYLGSPQMELDNVPVVIDRRKTLALLAHLAVNQRCSFPIPHRRKP